MLFDFRICNNPDQPDDAQGWIVASSELQAREVLGEKSHIFLNPRGEVDGIALGMYHVVSGELPVAT
jgi:hypothetical protein